MTPFVHLHVHSNYSPMSGVSSVEELCAETQAHGADALALTDTNGLYGAIRFIEVAKRTGLKPILGAELTHHHHRATLLATSMTGYTNLCRLLSARHCDDDFDLIEAVSHSHHDLIVLSDEIPALTAWKKRKRQNVYVELTPGAMMHQAVAFSRRSGIPPVATNRVQFVRPDQFHLHHVLRAIALKTTLSRLPAGAACSPHHWLTPTAVLEPHYTHVPHALLNARRIADRCHTEWNFKDSVTQAFRDMIEPHTVSTLQAKTYEGARWRYGNISKKVQDRIETELDVIQSKGFARWFLIVQDIVQQAPRTCGRGSAAASIVSYCLGITHVDPIRHNLFFERFLNAGRQDPPDIDIDFPWDERDRILDYVFTKYGTRRTAMVANHNTLSFRSAIREVARVYGLPPVELNRVIPRLVREVEFHEPPTKPAFASWAESLCQTMGMTEPWPAIISIALQLEGCLRTLGVHCGGVIIAPDEIHRHVPIQIASKGVPIIQWEKDQAEDAGLVKLDILGNRSLAVIRDTLDAVTRHTGCPLNEDTWDPVSDSRTQALIRDSDTIGCFYVESPATRLLLKKLWTTLSEKQPSELEIFEYLVMVSSLVRPAGNPYNRDFVLRAHGEPHQPVHQEFEQVLADTHGIMVYQEDVTRVAMAVAGFSVEEADQLRKILSKKHKERQLHDYKAQFDRGARAHGASDQAVTTMWNMIMSFSGYSFCKPHSASYAQVSYQSAYLRAHYPAEFMAAVVSNQGGFYAPSVYLSEARRMGLAILPPDINTSHWKYTGTDKAIRMGLMQIRGLKAESIEQVLAERANHGPFRSFQDFLIRTKHGQAQIRLLIKAGCFDHIAGEVTRPGLLWRLHAYHEQQRFGHPLQDTPSCHASSALPIPPDYSPLQHLQHEIESFGFPLSQHPLALHAEAVRGLNAVSARDMKEHMGHAITMIGWMITEKSVRTKHQEPMEFITFEDLTGLYEATLFPKVYRRFGHLLTNHGPYILEGTVEEEFQTYSLIVKNVRTLTGDIPPRLAVTPAPHQSQTKRFSPEKI
ncbi:MAG: DNA polymerase III subunit alpha [Nitrospirales bacterium]|nr:DNA polymerase III subunit alpha [Nitrospirales bacterium]